MHYVFFSRNGSSYEKQTIAKKDFIFQSKQKNSKNVKTYEEISIFHRISNFIKKEEFQETYIATDLGNIHRMCYINKKKR